MTDCSDPFEDFLIHCVGIRSLTHVVGLEKLQTHVEQRVKKTTV